MTLPVGSLAALSGMLRYGEATPLEVAEACLARIAEADGTLRAFLEEPEREQRVLAEARAVALRWPDAAKRPPLFGVPVGIKDLFRVDGLPTRAGSQLPESEFAGPEAGVVKRLRDAGAVILGKTTTDEFAYADPPPTRNPRDPSKTPGGSSAGSAAAVAAGMCPLALGTQTSRSIVAPAAFCGVAGLKPSHGRVPIDGVFPLAPSMDVVGWLAADARGLAIAAAALLEDWRPADEFPSHEKPPLTRLGIPVGKYLLEQPTDEWRAPFEDSVRRLKGFFEVVQVDLGWDAGLEQIYGDCITLLNGEFAQSHRELFARHAALYRRASRSGVEAGMKIAAEDIARTRERGLLLRSEIGDALSRSGVDALLSPSQPGPAPEFGGRTGWGSTTAPWSYAGLPCISLPVGRAGVQLIGRFREDERLLAVAQRVEPCLGAPGERD